jgi:O-antigen/teichoic acid export membrane protein
MSKGIMSNSIMNAAAGMLLLVTGFACSIAIARLLGPEANGTIAFALWVATTGALVAELGTGVLLMRCLPQLKARGLGTQDRRGFAAYLALPVLVSTVLLVILYASASWEAEREAVIGTPESIVILTGALLFVQSIGALTKNYLVGEQRLSAFFRITALSSTLQLVLVIGGAFGWGVEGALLGYIAGQAAPFAFALGILLSPRNSAGFAPKALISSSAVLFFEFVLSAVFLNRPELFFLQQFRSLEEVGFYAVALSLANLALQLPVQLTGSLLPFYVDSREGADGVLPAGIFAAVTRSFAYITFPLCFGLAAIAEPLVVTIYGESFRPSGLIVAILAAGSPAFVFSQLTTQYLYSMDRIGIRLVTTGIGALVMLIGCIAVIPQFGGPAGALVRGGTFLLICVLLLRSMKSADMSPRLALTVCKVAAAAAVCGLVAFAVTDMVPGLAGLTAGVIAGALAYAVSLRLMRAVDPADAHVLDMVLSRSSARLAPLRHGLSFVARAKANAPAK